jgi:hypothetical protein
MERGGCKMKEYTIIDLSTIKSIEEMKKLLEKSQITADLENEVLYIRTADSKVQLLLRRIGTVWYLNTTIEGAFETGHAVITLEPICPGEVEFGVGNPGSIWIKQ